MSSFEAQSSGCTDTFLIVGYGYDTTFHNTGGSNTTGPGVLLASGEEFSSLSVRFVLQDSNEMERQGLGVRKTMMTLAPSLMENPMIWMITDITGCKLLLFSLLFSVPSSDDHECAQTRTRRPRCGWR